MLQLTGQLKSDDVDEMWLWSAGLVMVTASQNITTASFVITADEIVSFPRKLYLASRSSASLLTYHQGKGEPRGRDSGDM